MNRAWSEKEDEILRQHYVYRKYGTGVECVKLLSRYNRSLQGVHSRARVLRIGKLSDKIWTTKQLNILHDYAGVIPLKKLSKKVKRSEEAIKTKCRRLGISIANDDGTFTIKELARLLNTDENWVAYRINKGLFGNVVQNGYKTQYHIKPSDIKTFFRRYPSDLDELIQHGKRPDGIFLVEILAGILYDMPDKD